MTAITAPSPVRAVTPERSARGELARLEARRHLRSLPLWLGAALSVFFAASVPADWQSNVYTMFPVTIAPFAAGVFIVAIRSGGRDLHADLPPLAQEAALDDDARVAARLLGMAPVVGLAALAVVAAALGIRVEGGHWIGDEPGRIDTAVHTLPEVLQPILLVAVAAAAGVAAGRTFRRRAPAAVLGVVVLLALGTVSWAWQGVPARYVTLVQTQPIEVTIGPVGANPADFPAEWLLSRPDQYDADWDRVIVHEAMAAWHDVYLLGLGAVAVGAALRGGRGRRIAAAGLAIAVLGVAAQVAVAPDSGEQVAQAHEAAVQP